MKLIERRGRELHTIRIFIYTAINPDFTINQIIVDSFGGVYFFMQKE
jgi:hypothetical protein